MMLSLSSAIINTDLLRSHLDQLHSEVNITRRKADNARFRLLRLSEAAENLCRQAALSVRKGKEDEARELLFQKRKIMLALEKSKGRVDLLDELAAKLNEAISIKEAQLVENVTSELDIDGNDGEGPVRIVSPTQDRKNTSDYNYNTVFNLSDVDGNDDLEPDSKNEDNMMSYSENEDDFPNIKSRENEVIIFRSSSSYMDFLEDLDQQLAKIENDLMIVLELPALLLENEEIPDDSKVKKLEIFENIRDARVRIQKYLQEISESSEVVTPEER